MVTTMRLLATTFILALFTLAGCNEAKQAASYLASEAIKSDDQRKAEQTCVQEAVNHEAQRTPGLKKILDTPAETQILGPNHYLVRVTYKMVTLDDPGTTSNDLNSYSGATCEVNQGRIVNGKLDERLVDILNRRR